MTGTFGAVSHQDYLDVASASDLPTFHKRLVAFAHRMEFPLVNATLVVEQPGAPAVILPVRNTPVEFAEQTIDATSGRRDPVLQRLKTMSIPFVYDQALYVQGSAGDLWEEQAQFGYRTGVALAMHMSEGRHFVLGIDRPDALPKNPDHVAQMMANLQLMAAYAQSTAVRLLLPKVPSNAPAPTLTAREQEVLRWARDGKSNSVIAQLLTISERTVNYHLSAAMRKLGVATKHQAAAKAQALRLL